MKSRFNTIIHFLNPDPPIGGFEVTDGAVRFVMLGDDGSVTVHAARALPIGVVVGGVIADETAFRSVCLSLRREIRGFRALPVVVSLPPKPVYAQVFAVPFARQEQLEEAARLNLRMLSPIDFDTAYADWQKISDTPNADGSVDALGAFVEARVADAYHASLLACGFLPIAIEFSSLSLARAIAASADMGDPQSPYLVVSLTGDGMTLLVIQGSTPQFTEYTGWNVFSASATNGQVTMAQFQAVLGAAIRRFLNFYRGRFHGDITKALIINATPNTEVAEWIKKEFPMEVFSLAGYATLGKEWCVAAGAALRGLVPRREDVFISLARVGTEDEFERNHVRRFVSLWRAVALSVLFVTVLIYIVLDMFMVQREQALASRLYGDGTTGNAEVAALAAQAANFNILVDKALGAGMRAVPQTPIFRALNAAAGSAITFTRIDLNALGGTVLVQGQAKNEQGVIAFKGILANNPAVADVSLPLSAITAIAGGGSSFTATITFKR